VFLSGSYIKKLDKDSTHFATIAIQPGFTTRSFNVSALTFDEQWDGDSYNASIPNTENFSKTRITYADMGAGLAYLWRKTARTQVGAGVSFLHLNRPKQSFFENDDIRLDVKTSISALAQFPVAAQVDVLPTVLYQRQGKFQETVLGVSGKYYLNPVNGATTAISLGGFYRMKDAFIMSAGMEYRNFNVGLSYDVNTSRLREATNSRGGFEISVIYIFKKAVPFIAKKRVCPIYM
jgi:type IX secretion system PorP/SprF family membrane protein